MSVSISPAVKLVWQIADNETHTTRHRRIEREHILVGICKIGDVLALDAPYADMPDSDAMKPEVKALDELFLRIHIDRKDLKRIIREIIGNGGYTHTENTLHRSESCKGAFNRAAKIAQSVGSETITVLHLLAAIMEEPGDYVEKAINDAGVSIEAMREALMKSLNRPLNVEDIKRIAFEVLNRIRMELIVEDVFFDVSEEVLSFLCDGSCDSVNGERLIKLATERLIDIPLNEKMLKGELPKGCIVEVCLYKGNVVFEVTDVKKMLEDKLQWASSYQEDIADDKAPAPDSSEGKREFTVIMFTDLKGSVEYFERYGTIDAHTWICNHNKIVIPIIESHDGRVVKKIGDAVMASFKTPAESVRASIDIQRSIARNNETTEEARRHYVRIGINAGDVLYKDGDFYGSVVNIASRVQNLTPPGTVYIAEGLYRLLENDVEFRIKPLGEMTIKGMKTKLSVYEVDCNDGG
ncbi:adenylate/guanylate cyclase domain-containing protein [Candidatus Magnetobacterium casense]|uniref:Guanylate cyclase domain-containing protein n=1 Tax=Candidatus Magnetobacterium casense TaxID=1455061 RepID=A0ABS6S2D5_9BACT|nr:adenylate/guanylate cyclase domain-containing protein [Candidatus Magnetobacterium casensis]MBV6343001.1 hypothetical protein [Candidatus Magnetobacterium casensis]